MVVLESIHELLRGGRQATQRDLYYKVRYHAAKRIQQTQKAIPPRRIPCPALSATVLCKNEAARVVAWHAARHTD